LLIIPAVGDVPFERFKVPHRVLIAEAEKIFRDRLLNIARSEGLDTCPAESGREAVDAAKSVAIDVALMDFILPDLTALELISAIRRLQRRVQSVVLIENDSKEVRMQVMGAGVYSVIRKPFPDEVVAFTIREIIRKFFSH
jgi:CheY-like chemotaxis protein